MKVMRVNLVDYNLMTVSRIILLLSMLLIIAFREKGDLPMGQYAKMTGSQMTEYMKQFPQSQRRGQTNPTSYYYKFNTAKR